jgi:hypothetical protein
MIEFFFSDPLLLAIASSSSNGIAELSIRKWYIHQHTCSQITHEITCRKLL